MYDRRYQRSGFSKLGHSIAFYWFGAFEERTPVFTSGVFQHTMSSPPHLNSFLQFCKEQRQAIRSEDPFVSNTIVTKKLAQRWKSLTSSEKARYKMQSLNTNDEGYQECLEKEINPIQPNAEYWDKPVLNTSPNAHRVSKSAGISETRKSKIPVHSYFNLCNNQSQTPTESFSSDTYVESPETTVKKKTFTPVFVSPLQYYIADLDSVLNKCGGTTYAKNMSFVDITVYEVSTADLMQSRFVAPQGAFTHH